jgi:hypothetical protein
MLNWKDLPEPTYLDCPKISAFASKGWTINDPNNNSSGSQPFPIKHLGISVSSSKKLTGKVTLRITTRQKDKQDLYLKYCDENGIAYKNVKEMSLLTGRIIQIQNERGMISKCAEEAQLICFVCTQRKPLTEMQADHCQPVTSIHHRLKSFFSDENYQKNYVLNKTNPNFKKLFIFEKKDNETFIQPNYFYGLGFTFSEDNIWPVCQTCNGFREKGATNPFDYLKSQSLYGNAFFKEKFSKIDSRGILIRTEETAKTIAEAAIEWFTEKYEYLSSKEMLEFEKTIYQIQKKFHESFQKNDKKKCTELLKFLEKATDL